MNKTERNEILKELDRETEYYSDHTRSQYFNHVHDFLDYVGENDWKDRDVVYNYTKVLKKRGHSQSHINYLVRGPIGALFRAHGLRIPIKLPKASISMVDLAHRVNFTREEVQAIVTAVRAKGNPVQKSFMALSTIYGLRASEIRSVRKEDVHPKKRTIYVHTLKAGLDREHVVPDQIAPYVFGHDYPLFSENRMHEIFREIATMAGIERPSGKGYHAIRHALASELMYVKKADQPTMFKFLRWKGGTVMNVYATPYEPDIDQTIFAIHPFLEFWE